MNRREILGLGTAAIALGLGATPLAQSADGAPMIRWVVARDRRHAPSRRFAEVFAGHGAEILDIDGDIMRLWREVLRARPDTGNLRLTGLTEYSEFLVMRGNARERGLKLRFEAGHEKRDAAIAHTLRRRDPDFITLPGFTETTAFWPETLAAHIVAPSAGRMTARDGQRGLSADSSRFALHSWLIA